MLEQHYLTPLFEPKSVAVIGASDREDAVGNIIFRNILSSGYTGRLYAINPEHETIQGQPCHKSIEEIGARVELAIIATRAQTVPALIEQCGRSSVRNVIVISSGFSESGHIGAAIGGGVHAPMAGWCERRARSYVGRDVRPMRCARPRSPCAWPGSAPGGRERPAVRQSFPIQV